MRENRQTSLPRRTVTVEVAVVLAFCAVAGRPFRAIARMMRCSSSAIVSTIFIYTHPTSLLPREFDSHHLQAKIFPILDYPIYRIKIIFIKKGGKNNQDKERLLEIIAKLHNRK